VVNLEAIGYVSDRMSKSSPPDPQPIKLNECLAVLVAFTTITGLLYSWTLNKKNGGFGMKKLRSLPPSPQPNSTSQGLPTAKPTASAPESLSVPLTASRTTPALSSSSPLTDKSLSQKPSNPEKRQANTSPASPIPTAPSPTSGVEFSDVPNGSWASRFIQLLKKRNLVVGFADGSFRPNQFATRAEFATLIQKVVDQENRHSAVNFKDLSADYWASGAIKQVSKTEILKGYPAGDFRPDQPVTRAEVLVALATALKLKTPSTPAKTLQVFKDNDQVLDYAIAKVAAAKEAGLVAGYPKDEIIVPNKPATRAEMAAMVYQALAKSGKEEQIGTRL
jgi:hypothetical protein